MWELVSSNTAAKIFVAILSVFVTVGWIFFVVFWLYLATNGKIGKAIYHDLIDIHVPSKHDPHTCAVCGFHMIDATAFVDEDSHDECKMYKVPLCDDARMVLFEEQCKRCPKHRSEDDGKVDLYCLCSPTRGEMISGNCETYTMIHKEEKQ